MLLPLQLLLTNVFLCVGHKSYIRGRLVEPPPRLSLWRYGYGTPKYPRDNQLFCQTSDQETSTESKNETECGLCGEPYKLSENYETDTGRPGTIVVRSYRAGQKIKIKVLLESPTLTQGWFQFHVCPKCTENERETRDCFSRHPLEVLTLVDEIQLSLPEMLAQSNPWTKQQKRLGYYRIPAGLAPNTKLIFILQLPPSLFCAFCVFRWRYLPGKTPSNMKLSGCSDIRIVDLPGTEMETEKWQIPLYCLQPTYHLTGNSFKANRKSEHKMNISRAVFRHRSKLRLESQHALLLAASDDRWKESYTCPIILRQVVNHESKWYWEKLTDIYSRKNMVSFSRAAGIFCGSSNFLYCFLVQWLFCLACYSKSVFLMSCDVTA